jgi:hypothetical protein
MLLPVDQNHGGIGLYCRATLTGSGGFETGGNQIDTPRFGVKCHRAVLPVGTHRKIVLGVEDGGVGAFANRYC